MNAMDDSKQAGRASRVLVIIVNYKSARLTLDAVASLESDRSNPALELRVVVVENNSGDAAVLRDGLAGLPHAHLIEAPKNGGFAYGNNLGFEYGYESGFQPDFFLMLNPDTRASPGAVWELCRFMEGRPKVGLAGSSLQNADGSDWPIAFRFPSIIGEIEQGVRFGPVSRLLGRWIVARPMKGVAERVDWLPGAALMARREVIDTIGGMDERYFLYYEETDYCLKATRAGFECWYVPDSRVMHISGQSTGVTKHGEEPERYPAYWFESRRRYFTKNHGLLYASATDVAFSVSAAAGWLKSKLLRRQDSTALFAYDVLKHSPCLPSNRDCPPERSFHPSPSPAPTNAGGPAL